MGWTMTSAWAGPAPPADLSNAIHAIQQAPDPSSVVSAYAGGVAIDPDSPRLYEAYISRMVDLGLPELAYRQALTLTTLEPSNGLAWGVVAYIDARRGDMVEAVSAINVAGQAAPDIPFVQRTAGEILAWYDTKADQAKLPESARNGLADVRARVQKESAFVQAYDTAKSAYLAQAENSAPQPPAQSAPSQYGSEPEADQVAPFGYASASGPAPAYSPDYYYDWGSSWVEPAPWWWWQPVGYFAGFDFVPFSTFVVFDNDGFFFHNHFFHHDRDDFFFHHDHGAFSHNHGVNVAFHDPAHAFFHRNGTTFFGAAARPTATAALSARANFSQMSGPASRSSAIAGVTRGTLRSPATFSRTPMVLTPPRLSPLASPATALRSGMFNSTPRFMPAMPLRSAMIPPSNFRRTPWSPQFRPGITRLAPSPAFRPGFAAPGSRTPAFIGPGMAPRPAAPMARGFAGPAFRGGMGIARGGVHGGMQAWHR